MGPLGSLLIGVLTLGTSMGATIWRKRARAERRRELRAKPFRADWVAHLEKNVVLYNRLPDELREELHGHIHVFLDEKGFEGCNDLEVTEEMRVTIAGLACLLLLNRETDYYPKLTSILVYPGAYLVDSPQKDGVVESDETQVRLGESWVSGNVVLSWSDVVSSSHDPKDGHNLTLHEFAHQLDQEDGRSDGVPLLAEDAHYDAWAEVLSAEYHQLRRLTEKGRKSLLDAYGATNPAEFFAVATETFFERPRHMKRKHRELYDELKEFYQVDPAGWKSRRR